MANTPVPADGRDPSVRVPAAVRAAAQRSADLMKAAAEGNPPPGDPGEPLATMPQPAPRRAQPRPAEPATPPAPEPTPPAPEPTPPAEPIVPPAPAPTPLPPAAEKTVEEVRAEYLAMEGRFKQQNKISQQLQQEVTNLRNLIATMQTPAPAAPDPALTAKSLLTPQEVSEYGEDFLDVVGRKAREIAATETASLKAELEALKKGVTATQQVSAATARENMLSVLDRDVPNWRDINIDQNFIQWLSLPDAFSGVIRQELLNAAYGQNNTPRVLAFFKGFLTEEAAVAPATDVPPVPAPQPQITLESLAAPGRAKSSAAPTPEEKPIITRAQVTAFYADVAAGKYRGKDAEKDRLEAMIFSATNEGRLR